jgi:hypothetical protein
VSLPFTTEQFLAVFAAYNRSLWLFPLALWILAAGSAIALARARDASRLLGVVLAVQWAWAGLAYHAAFFTAINPAAWLFGAAFLIQSAALAWFAVAQPRLHLSPRGAARHVAAWVLMLYSLAYPGLVLLDGHRYPEAPTFGVPCPTTLLTIGVLLAADPPWPRAIAIIPIAWAIIAGSSAVTLGVRADLMLWPAAAGLAGYLFAVRHEAIET